MNVPDNSNFLYLGVIRDFEIPQYSIVTFEN